MKQNTLSIDFKFARVSGNVYTFGYDIYRSVTASTEITVQNWNNKAAIPAYYDKANQRLYAYGVNGYWDVFVNSLTFTSVPPDSERIDALETSVGVLEGNITSLANRVDAIVMALNNAIIYRNAIGNPVILTNAIDGNFSDLAVTITTTQLGSGDPSPSNIRPVSGISSVTVTRTGENGANPASVTVSLVDSNSNPMTVYGGTLNVTTGELIVDRKVVTLTGHEGFFAIGYASDKSDRTARISVQSANVAADADYSREILCTHATRRNYNVFGPWGVYSWDSWLQINDNTYFLMDYNLNASIIDNFIAYLAEQATAGTPWQFVYYLSSPITYTLTAAQLAALAGYNSVSTNAENVNITYASRLSLE